MDSRTCTRGWEASPSTQVFLHSNQDQSLQWTLSPHWYCSVAKSCLTLCDYMFGNKEGFPVFHYFPEFPQTHVFESVMPSHKLILLFPLLLLTIFPSISTSFNELGLHIRWPKCWSLNFSLSLSIEYCSTTSKTKLMFPNT